jgi:hypothetical protein
MKTCCQVLSACISAALLSCTILCGVAGGAQLTGKIVGTVQDEKGAALPGAKVNALPLDGRPQGAGIRYVETDAGGRFVIDRLPWGKYSVFAMKQEAGYPDMEPSFYSAGTKIPVAVITPAAPVAAVSIQFGPRAAIVSGTVSDSATGAPINAFFALVRTRNKEDWLSISAPSSYRLLVPALTDIEFSVTAPGYEKWTSPSPINMQSGQELHLNVELAPAYNRGAPASKFLIPDGYVGWLLLAFNQKNAPATTLSEGGVVFKFPESGRLETSSPGPEPDSKKMYLYYGQDGSVRDIPMDYRNGNGLIWGEHGISVRGARTGFGFFVGTHDQYEQSKNPPPVY